jgi:hypothetical protein
MTRERESGTAAGCRKGCAALLLGLLLGVWVPPAGAQDRGVQTTPDDKRTLVNKDIGTERYAISRNPNGAVTGNVFRADGGDLAFLYCFPIEGPDAFSCWGADACTDTTGLQRNIQRASNGIILVNKDVAGERYAINLNHDGTVTGNVFRGAAVPPAFLFCAPTLTAHVYECSGADACTTASCDDEPFTFIATVTLPEDFFVVPDPCSEAFVFAGEVTLPGSFFTAP